jgi:mono/diheme cytochrome c family protein
MASRLSVIGIAAVCAAAACPSHAQELGNAQRGYVYSEQFCSDCHRIGKESAPAGDPNAPSFSAVAKTKGMTAMALSVWLQTGHPTMPNIRLKPETMNDIIAYIFSLRQPPAKPAAN